MIKYIVYYHFNDIKNIFQTVNLSGSKHLTTTHFLELTP